MTATGRRCGWPSGPPADCPTRCPGASSASPTACRTSRSPASPTARTTGSTLRDLGPAADDLELGLLTTAVALEQWHQRHTALPALRCAPPTRSTGRLDPHLPGRRQRALPAHRPGGDHAGPRRRRPRACSAAARHWPAGRFSTLAGFVEPGESLEAAVAREVLEEVGVRIERHPLRRQPAVAVPVLADARLQRAAARRPERCSSTGRDGRGRLVHPRPRCSGPRDWTDTGEPAGSRRPRLRAVSPKLSISRYLIDCWLAGGLHCTRLSRRVSPRARVAAGRRSWIDAGRRCRPASTSRS